jgi:rare lipoprotein A
VRAVLAAAALALAAGCAHPRQAPPAPAAAPGPRRAVAGEVGLASWYGPRFHGRRTASGARYDQEALTAAHPTAPFGTRLRVTCLESGRSVVVTVNDRGPFVKGRVVDVSARAARALGMTEKGLTRVRVEPLGPG